MIEISVIVPIYNVEQYLEKCIKSILNQSFKNIEIILVNDCSTDNSLEIIKKYSSYDNIIIVNNTKNLGLSESRNRGIKIAKGKYVSFVDGDDFLEKDFLQNLYKTITSTNSDIAISTFVHWCYDKNIEISKSIIEYDDFHIIDKYSAIRDFLLRKNIHNYAWNKLYRKKLFEHSNIQYPKGKYYEDAYTTYKLLYEADKVCFTKKAIYYYVQRKGSIMNQRYSKRDMDYIFAVKEISIFLKKKNLFYILEKEYYSYYSNAYCSRFKKIILSNSLNRNIDDLIYIVNDVYENRQSLINNKYITYKHSILIKFMIILKKYFIK